MKKRDIIVMIACLLIIVGSVAFIFKSFSGGTDKEETKSKGVSEFKGEIDQKQIDELQNRKDYGVPSMDNIGRDNPFASL